LTIEAAVINQFLNKQHIRFLGTLEGRLTFQCGLNHLGDGNFFISISTSSLASVQKEVGENFHFEFSEDLNPLGVDIPEVPEIVIEQDEHLKAIFESLTLGKQRNIIHQISRIKHIGKQINILGKIGNLKYNFTFK